MDAINRLRDLLVEISQALNIYGLQQYTEHNAFHFVYDENTLVTIEYEPARRVVVLSSKLGVPVPSNVGRAQRIALGYGHQWHANGGCHVGLDLQSGEMTLYCQLGIDSFDADRLALLLLNFIEKSRAWQQVLATPDMAGKDLADEAAGDFVIRL